MRAFAPATAAMTDDTIALFSFPAVEGKKVTAAFDGGRLSSDGGVMLLSMAERRLGAGLLMLCLGTLSAMPIFASYVYFRLARDAWREDEPSARLRVRSFVVLGFLAAFAIAVLAQRGVHAEFDRISDAAIEGKTIGAVELIAVRLLAWGNEPDYILVLESGRSPS